MRSLKQGCWLLLFLLITIHIFAQQKPACTPLKQFRLTSLFGLRLHPITGRYQFHNGIDLAAAEDTVFAILPGRVGAVTYDPISGICIRLNHGDFQSLYLHLSQIFVLQGDSVTNNMPIGITGATGRVTAEHLHFSIKYRNQFIDPLKFLSLIINQ
jgi:murein DD-endopeptidase MepM/ murein hydrolase activator NlpD